MTSTQATNSESRKPKKLSTTEEAALVDAISYTHMLISDAYPSQFARAYPTVELRERARGVWAGALRRFSPKRIKRAADKAVCSGNKFMPSLGDIISLCKPVLAHFGLKSPLEAYYEACNMKNPSKESPWSHLAIYYAGRATGWFLLRNESQEKVQPLFEYNYHILCNRVQEGEPLDQDIDKSLEDFKDRNTINIYEQTLQQEQQQAMIREGIDPSSGRKAFDKIMKEWV